MKKMLLFLLFITKMFAQELPISESNYFVYDKYHFGVDVNNVMIDVHEKSSGEIICSEYSGSIYKINNTFLQKALPEIKDKNPLLIKYFEMPNGIEYYCTAQEIIVTKDRKIQKYIKINSQNDFSHSFQKLGSKIYFVTFYSDKRLEIRQFDGKKVATILKTKPKDDRYFHQLFLNDEVNLIEYIGNKLIIHKLKVKELIKIKAYTLTANDFAVVHFTDANNFSGLSNTNIFRCVNGIFSSYTPKSKIMAGGSFNPFFNIENNQEKNFFRMSDFGKEKLFNTTFSSRLFIPRYNAESNSYYCGTSTSFLRFFPHIKKYPRLFNKSNSTSTFTLVQDQNNRVWTGSYQGALSVIENDKVIQSKLRDVMFMNGSLPYRDKMILFGENFKGALLFSDANQYKVVARDNTFFYGYLSKNNQIYLGSSANGLWFTDTKNLEETNPKWNIVGENQGLKLLNILTICEDKFGNIWTGRSSQGIAVYNPETKKAKTWLIENKEINFGSMASILDSKKTLWFGTNQGRLVFYNGKSKNDYNVSNFIPIQHPLLENGKSITFIHQWKNYLILGAKDKILLFDVEKWHSNKKIAVRYLNSMETNLTSDTEQNTIFTDKRDQSIWFATSDMVYQWDIKKWLSLPTFKVTPSIVIKKDSTETEFTRNKIIEFEPTENSFDIQINYQTKDNMPRFINGVLAKKDEKPIFENPNLQTQFHFANVSAGDYVFYVRVCQQDGSFDVFEYPITIKNFLWQNWWFWFIVSLFPLGFLLFYFQKRNQIEKQKKRLSQLNLSSLSNQFRPHFMLNALNSIGSQIEGKPHAEKVISRLGESINILYGFTKKNDFTIAFQNEWKLVENSIEIQRLLFIPELVVEVNGHNILPINYKIPIGLFQIPIENALLHGLRNKTDGNCLLEINFSETFDFYIVTIADNGVGRENAAKMNDFKNNGKGLETVFGMLEIINQHQKNAIKFDIIDLKNHAGTKVTIVIRKNIDYDKIKL